MLSHLYELYAVDEVRAYPVQRRVDNSELELDLQMGHRRSVAVWNDTWRIATKCTFVGPRQLRVAVLANEILT